MEADQKPCPKAYTSKLIGGMNSHYTGLIPYSKHPLSGAVSPTLYWRHGQFWAVFVKYYILTEYILIGFAVIFLCLFWDWGYAEECHTGTELSSAQHINTQAKKKKKVSSHPSDT